MPSVPNFFKFEDDEDVSPKILKRLEAVEKMLKELNDRMKKGSNGEKRNARLFTDDKGLTNYRKSRSQLPISNGNNSSEIDTNKSLVQLDSFGDRLDALGRFHQSSDPVISTLCRINNYHIPEESDIPANASTNILSKLMRILDTNSNHSEDVKSSFLTEVDNLGVNLSDRPTSNGDSHSAVHVSESKPSLSAELEANRNDDCTNRLDFALIGAGGFSNKDRLTVFVNFPEIKESFKDISSRS